MTKYSYFSANKAGKLLIRNMFWVNGKTHVFFTTGQAPYYAVMTTPKGEFDWYWGQDKKLQTYHHVEESDIINKIYYNEVWHPVTGKIKGFFKSIDVKSSKSAIGFAECFNIAFDYDMITNPLVMMGYGGNLGSKNLLRSIQTREPTLNDVPLDYVIDELRKRKNIIAYKTNIRHMAHNFFVGSGRPFYKHPDVLVTQTDEGYIKECTKRINNNRAFPEAISKLLDYYDIPYEWFDLDDGDYNKTFDLKTTFNIADDPTPDNDLYVTDRKIVEGWIDDYVHLFQ